MIADGADAIRNAFYQTFDSAEMDIMCFAHVIRNVRKRSFSSKNNKQLIVDDIRKIQLAHNKATFKVMTRLFCQKWKNIEPEFIPYFKKEWLGAHCNWYEGAALYTPSTNNALESHNGIIKRKVTLRSRLPIHQFLLCMQQMAEDISNQMTSGNRNIETEPIITKQMMEGAAIMKRDDFKAFKAKTFDNSKENIYTIPSSSCAPKNSTEAYYKQLVQAKWQSFDEFINHGFHQFWIVKISKEAWTTMSSCTCPVFSKQFMCKHLIAVAFKENILECPNTANPMMLSRTKRAVGRPRATQKALIVQ